MVRPSGQGPACQACRKRHLSCDRETPSCRRCRAAGRPCTQRFHVRFSSRRVWAPPARSASPPSPAYHIPIHSPRDSGSEPGLDHPGPTRFQPPGTDNSQWQHRSTRDCVPDSPTFQHTPPIFNSPLGLGTISPADAPDRGSSRVLPLVDLTSEEVSLLQYFGDSIGKPWFDHTTPDFTIEALRYAPSCPVLCYSILALSSFYHCKAIGRQDGRADMFHQKAISILLTLMRDPSQLADGAGLAAVVILRLHEESKARQDGQDPESHLLAGHVFAATIASDEQQPATKLAEAAFWVHQRQDVFHSISQQKPTRTSQNDTRLWEPGDPSDLFTWTRRAQKLAAETADFCFGSDDTIPRERQYRQLEESLAEWSEMTWPTFQPVFFAERDVRVGRVLPELRFSLNTSLTGYVHYRLSLLLLSMYNPSSLALGPQAIDAHRQMESDVQNHVRALCGIARHNKCPIGKVIACLAITLGHRWIHDVAERTELLDVLKLCKQENAWSNHSLEQNLRVMWDVDRTSPITTTPMNPPGSAAAR